MVRVEMVLGEQKEIQEVKNAYEAYEKFDKIDPYKIIDIKRFHGIMTKYVVEKSGDFRRGEEGVFNGDQCIFIHPFSDGNGRMALMEKLGLKSKEGFQRYLKS